MKKFREMVQELETLIEKTYEEGVTLDDAEKLAAQFLHAQLAVSGELTRADLDSRMRKSGVKAIRGAVLLDLMKASDKKPADSVLTATIDTDTIVVSEQEAFDKAEVDKAELERLYDVFGNAHIYYRGIAKGKFE